MVQGHPRGALRICIDFSVWPLGKCCWCPTAPCDGYVYAKQIGTRKAGSRSKYNLEMALSAVASSGPLTPSHRLRSPSPTNACKASGRLPPGSRLGAYGFLV